jgi:hypothetical protein
MTDFVWNDKLLWGFPITASAFASEYSTASVRGCLAGMTNCARNDKLHKTYTVMYEIYKKNSKTPYCKAFQKTPKDILPKLSLIL